jgi:hypothetical protein
MIETILLCHNTASGDSYFIYLNGHGAHEYARKRFLRKSVFFQISTYSTLVWQVLFHIKVKRDSTRADNSSTRDTSCKANRS